MNIALKNLFILLPAVFMLWGCSEKTEENAAVTKAAAIETSVLEAEDANAIKKPTPAELEEKHYARRDVSNIDFMANPDLLINPYFDTNTIWPQNLPDGFTPAKLMEEAKNPGTQIKALHEQGITGKGVSLAFLSHRLNTSNPEFENRIMHYEEFGDKAFIHKEADNTSITGFVAGASMGIAPQANIYYIASEYRCASNENSIKRLIEFNNTLPEENKIKAAVMAHCIYMPGKEETRKLNQIMQTAKENGILIISSTMLMQYNTGIFSDSLPSGGNIDDTDSYVINKKAYTKISAYFPPTVFILPGIRRTLPHADGSYAYNSYVRSSSWLLGVYALAAQADKNINPDKFIIAATDTGRKITMPDGKKGIFIRPKELVKYLKNQAK